MAAGDEVVDTAEDTQGPEGGDDRGNLEQGHDHPVDHPQGETDPEPERDRRRCVQCVELEDAGDAIGDEPNGRFDRQVDIPRDDHQRLADGRDRDDRREDRDLTDVRDGQELGCRDRHQRAKHDHDRDEAELALPREDGQQPAPCSRHAGGG